MQVKVPQRWDHFKGNRDKKLIEGLPLSPTPREDPKGTECPDTGTQIEPPSKTIHDLPRATPGSAGLDLAAQKDYVLSPLDGIVVIETWVKGSLPSGLFGLILGRSSGKDKGVEVIPGVIDADTRDDIKILCRALREAVIIRKGQRIAQIILLPYVNLPNPILMQSREGQFGSSDVVAWTQEITAARPFLEIHIQGKLIKGLLDTGADKTCIAGKDWPQAWPVIRTDSTLMGLGMAANVAKSSGIIPWRHGKKTGHIQPYVIPSLPFSLWGRDIMQDLNLALTTDNVEDQYFS